MPLLSPGHAATLLERVIYEEVLHCVQIGMLRDLEEMLAIELFQIETLEDDEALLLVREMLTRGLVRCVEAVQHEAEEAARSRYFECVLRSSSSSASMSATP